jgi:hypothetical protein
MVPRGTVGFLNRLNGQSILGFHVEAGDDPDRLGASGMLKSDALPGTSTLKLMQEATGRPGET